MEVHILNAKLQEFKNDIRSKKIAVLGIGVSNISLITFLSKCDVSITAFDKQTKDKLAPLIQKFDNINIRYCLGPDYLDHLSGFDIIFKTPGMRIDIPQLVKASQEEAKITSEMEEFIKLCPAQIFAVTGSDGKTTTTSIIYNILKEEGYNCYLGGNIGTPLLDRIEKIQESDKVVLELSSFQLHTIDRSPNIAIITNISPNHLDIHKSMEEYIDAKKNIFKHQTSGKVILNYDNEITRKFEHEVKTNLIFFSRNSILDIGAYLKGDTLVYKPSKSDCEIEVLNKADILIPGQHNIENYLSAILAVFDYVKIETIKKVASTFSGVEHRIKFVREVKGVKFYNDSVASSPSRTIAGLKTFPQKVILIAGGYDKKIPYDIMGENIINMVKCLVLIGQTGPKIKKAYLDELERKNIDQENAIPIINCTTLKEATMAAFDNAKPNDIVLLSPASASFDMFKNFDQRGQIFIDIVRKI